MILSDFYPILLEEAKLSKDPSRKICAVAFDGRLNRLASGYNGAPRGVEDSALRYMKPLKNYYVVHAEANLVASAARLGISLQNSSVLITELQPCANCAGLLVQAGVLEVWYPEVPASGKSVSEAWRANFEHSRQIFKEAGVSLRTF
jgi:dCMP deaminase